jgi:hypothetical protein
MYGQCLHAAHGIAALMRALLLRLVFSFLLLAAVFCATRLHFSDMIVFPAACCAV